MNKIEASWEDVHEGHYIQDKTGKWWYVAVCNGFRDGHIRWLLEDKDGNEVEVKQPNDPLARVTIMYDPKTLIEQKLDGKEIS